MTALVDNALDYAARGWRVLPLHEPLFNASGICIGCTCEAYARSERNKVRLEAKGQRGRYDPNYICPQPGKHPRGDLVPKGVSDASADPAIIRSWWKRYPKANVGIACGASGLLALDADLYKDVFSSDLGEFDENTVTSLTGGGGTHLIYTMPDGATYGNSPGDLPEGIDIRGAGGYIVAPPSLHPSGRHYEWEGGYAPGEIALAPMPLSLRQRLDATVHMAGKDVGPPDSEAVSASIDLVQRVLHAGKIAHSRPEVYDGDGRRIKLDKCPFNPLEDPHAEDGAAVVIIRPDGQIKVTCNHNRCKAVLARANGNGWALLRAYAGVGVAHMNGNGYSALADPYEDAPHPADDEEYLPVMVAQFDRAASDLGSLGAEEDVGLPDVDPMGLLDRGYAAVDLGIIGEFADLMFETVGSNRSYHEIGGLVMFASAIQHRWLPVTWANRSKLRPNLYAGILGRSSLWYKSTALSKVSEHMPWDNLLNCKQLPGYFTEEGLYKEFADSSMGLIVRDEIGSLFAARNKKYTEGLEIFLTTAFDGWVSAKRLSGQSYLAREIAVSIIGATTFSEFSRTTTDADWNSGWLPRWLFALPDVDYNPGKEQRWLTDNDHAFIGGLQRRLMNLNAPAASPMSIERAAYIHLTDWRLGLIKEIMANEERHEWVDTIIGRYAPYAWKFAMILCAARGDGERVTLAQAQDGERLAENYMTNLFRLYEYQKAHRMTGALLNKALAVLSRHAEGLTRRELGQLLRVSATMRDEIISLLLDAGAVMEEPYGRTTHLTASQKKITFSRVTTSS